jgi:hypothetical protein
MKKLFSILLIAVLVLSVGCSADNDAAIYKNQTDRQWGGFAPELNETSYMRYSDGQSEVAGAAVEEFVRKIIRNATLTLKAREDQNVTDLYAQLVEYCDSVGGYEFGSDINHTELYSSVQAVLKLPPEKLNDFMLYVGENAIVLNSKIDTEDVTAEFYDLQTRLDTKRRSLESYYALLEGAGSTSEIVSLQRTIDGITEDIESIQGRLRVLNSRVDMATVTLTIHRNNEPEPEPRRDIDWNALSADDMWYLIKNGFIWVVNAIALVIQWLVIVIVVVSPLAVPLAIFVTVMVRRDKKKRAKIIAQASEKENEKNEQVHGDGDK